MPKAALVAVGAEVVVSVAVVVVEVALAAVAANRIHVQALHLHRIIDHLLHLDQTQPQDQALVVIE